MKSLVLVFSLFMSVVGYAADLDLSISQGSPVVIDTDFTHNPGADDERNISGPWIMVDFTMTNISQDLINVAALQIVITTDEGVAHQYDIDFGAPALQLRASESGMFREFIELPESSSHHYKVTVEPRGWVDGADGIPARRITGFLEFITQ